METVAGRTKESFVSVFKDRREVAIVEDRNESMSS
jgi:hypothetical protein